MSDCVYVNVYFITSMVSKDHSHRHLLTVQISHRFTIRSDNSTQKKQLYVLITSLCHSQSSVFPVAVHYMLYWSDMHVVIDKSYVIHSSMEESWLLDETMQWRLTMQDTIFAYFLKKCSIIYTAVLFILYIISCIYIFVNLMSKQVLRILKLCFCNKISSLVNFLKKLCSPTILSYSVLNNVIYSSCT